MTLKQFFPTMLEERVTTYNKYSNIGTITDVQYAVDCILNKSVSSLASLSESVLLFHGRSYLQPIPFITLSFDLDLIKGSIESFEPTDNFKTWKYLPKEKIEELFSEKLVDFIIDEQIIDLSSSTYSSSNDSFWIPKSNFNSKFVCLRNALISFGLMTLEGTSFCLNGSFAKYFQKPNRKRSHMTEATLLKLLEQQRVQGESGEIFVLNFEINRLNGHSSKNKIKRISPIDVSAGYDIISYNNVYSESLDRYIEVKTYQGEPHFFWSKNEMEFARKKQNNYFIYLIDLSKINEKSYSPTIIQNPIQNIKATDSWEIATESYLISQKNPYK